MTHAVEKSGRSGHAGSGNRLANLPPCLIGMETCVGAHHLSRKLDAWSRRGSQ